MSASANNGDRQLTWFNARRCYKKYCGGKVYYLRGDNSHEDTLANYQAALAELTLRIQQADRVALEVNVAQTVREAVEQIEECTDELRHTANKRFKTLGLSVIAGPMVKTRPLEESSDSFLGDIRSRAERGEISVGRYEHMAGYMRAFLDFAGRETDANAISESVLQAYRAEITGRIGNGKDNEISDYTAKYHLQAAGNLVEFLWQHRLLLDLPRNMKTFKKVKVARRPVKYFTVEQVKSIWATCENDWHRLFVSLALNTAMNQADMARLTPENLQPPHLVLKRGKTGVMACWKLWPVTQKLIDKFRRPKAKMPTDLLFLTRDGRPLVERGFSKNGGTFHNDAVHQVFKRVLEKAGVDGTFVMLRKTVASTLRANGYGDVVQFFLAHDNDALFLSNGVVTKEPSNGSVAETFYVAEHAKIHALKNHSRLIEAVDLLERIFGISDTK